MWGAVCCQWGLYAEEPERYSLDEQATEEMAVLCTKKPRRYGLATGTEWIQQEKGYMKEASKKTVYRRAPTTTSQLTLFPETPTPLKTG